MSKSNMKKAGAILAVVVVGAFAFNTIAKRVPVVSKARAVVRNGL